MKKFISNNLFLLFASFLFSFLLFNAFNNKVDIPQVNSFQEENEPENPLERIKQRIQIRADENGYIPMDGIIKAKEQRDRLLNVSKEKNLNDNRINDGGIRGWEWLGPGNIGGRIRAILIDPGNVDRIWIGSVSGGIWVTENGGDYWNPVNDFMANLAISSIVMDPDDHNILYAGTGEIFTINGLPGAGIFKSTDRGNTWELLSSTRDNKDFKYVSRLAVDPNQTYPNHIVYAATSTGLFRSFNGGRTWVKKLSAANVYDIDISPTDHNYILVGTSRDVYLSTDGGSSFEKQTTGKEDKLPDTTGRCEVAIAPSNKFIMYVSKNINGGEIWRSLNGGTTWQLMNTGTNYLVSGNGNSQGDYDNALWVSPTNMNFIVVGGIDLWRSDTGGIKLEKISDWLQYHLGLSAHADQHIIVEHPKFGSFNNKTVYFGNDGGIQKAEDIEAVSPSIGWENLANHLGITQFYGGAATSNTLTQFGYGGWIFGGAQDNSTLRYKPEDGTNWYQAITGDGGFCALDDSTPLGLIIYMEMPHLDIWKGVHNGDSYVPYHFNITGVGKSKSSLFVAPLVNAPKNKSFYLAGGVDIWWNYVDNSNSENGDNWTSIFQHPDSSRCSAISIFGDGTSSIYIGFENGDIYKSAFGVEGPWERVDSKDMPNRYVTNLVSSAPRRTEIVIATFGTYDNPNIWLSEDGGNSWRDATGTGEFKLPQVPINTVTLHPENSNTIYVGTDLGVYASDDLGETWSVVKAYPDNEGPANVEVSELFWQDDYLIAATYGRGMFRCRPKISLYVDKNADATTADGSVTHPYKTVQDAINASGNGTNIYIIGNTYSEAPVVFDRAGTINAVNGKVIIE